ncbi:kell blood group glycoprotein [Aplochiton taeniatus]
MSEEWKRPPHQPLHQFQCEPQPQPQRRFNPQTLSQPQGEAQPQPESGDQPHPPEEVKPWALSDHRRVLLLLLGSSFLASILGLAYYYQQPLESMGDRQPDKELKEESGPGGSAVQKARAFYRSCMDTGAIETAGAEPFLRLIQKLDGWAVFGPWNKSDFNATLALLMRNYATFPFFNIYVGKDPNDIARGTTRKYIQIDQPEFHIPTEWSSKTQKSKANAQILRPFLASCHKYLSLLGAPPRTSSLHVGLFISLSSELAVAASPLSHRLVKGHLYQHMTIRELQAQAPNIDWLGCLQSVFHPHPVSQEDHVLLHNLPYIVQMSQIIGKWLNRHELSGSGPLHTYMVFSLLHTLIPALDSRFAETERNFSLALGSTDEKIPRWQQCVLDTERGFDTVITYLLNQRTAHREAEEMIQNIFSSFKSKLTDLEWRDEDSRLFVMNKVLSLTPRLSSKIESPSEEELNRLYSKVEIRAHDHFSNYIQLLSLLQKRRNKLFIQTEEADILSMAPMLLGNELVFPMGMFVPPLFHSSYPRAVNYGVLGTLMAKDILHLLLPDIHSQSESVQAVGECVWAHYLSVTGEPGSDRSFTFTPAQQQEMWVQYYALQVALQAYHQSLRHRPGDTSLLGLSHIHLLLNSFARMNCDSDPYTDLVPFESSFMITVLCGNADICPTTLACPNKPQLNTLQRC